MSKRPNRRDRKILTRLNDFGRADDREVMRRFGYHGAERVADLLPLMLHQSHEQRILFGTQVLPSSAEEARLPRRRIGRDVS